MPRQSVAFFHWSCHGSKGVLLFRELGGNKGEWYFSSFNTGVPAVHPLDRSLYSSGESEALSSGGSRVAVEFDVLTSETLVTQRCGPIYH